MSKMSWFKLHSDFRNDPKIKLLPIAERYAFIILLCLARESETRGTITGLDDDDIAFELEIQSEDWQTLKAKFKTKGFIDFSQEQILIRNWDKRQYDKPSDHPEATKQRKRLQREKIKLTKKPDVTPVSRDVTPVSRGRGDKNREEEIRLEEIREEEENTRSENIYASCDENFPDSDLPANQVLIDCMAEEKETPIPPTPFSPSPENVGLAIAASKKTKSTSLDTKRNKYQVFLDVWLQEKPDDWVDHKTLSKTAISKLETFAKTHGNESMAIFQKSLWYAKNDSYHKKVLKGWTLEQYLSNEKPYQYYEKYEQAPKKDSANGESIMSSDEIKKARIYAQLQQAMGVAS